jgi:cell division septum initiation protein DivIVA
MRSVLWIKPLLDEVYVEMNGLYEEVERYKKEVEEYKREAEGYKRELEELRKEIVDTSYASSATAAPRSEVGVTRRISSDPCGAAMDLIEACPVKEESTSDGDVFNFGGDTVKNVVISENEQKCADRKEYYRVYRLKQKELKASKINK